MTAALTRSGLAALTLVPLAARSGLARQLREAAGASQPEVGEACGVSHVATHRWESAQRLPRGAAARRYVAVLTELAARVGDLEDPALRALQRELLELRDDASEQP